MRDLILAILQGDNALMALLTGGVYDAEISRQATAAAFDTDTNEILPCATILMGTSIPITPHSDRERQYFNVILYQRSGYDVIDPAADRLYTLLHDVKPPNASGGSGVWRIQWADNIRDREDTALSCSMRSERFQIVKTK